MQPSNNRALFIFFFAFAVLLAVITGFLPFIIERRIEETKLELSKPHSDNVDIWGKFPGKLKTILKHTFTFFDYPTTLEDNADLPLSNKSITFTESIVYQNFSFDDKEDKITFKAKREYDLSKPLPDSETVKLPSMGMMELFQTLSNPSLYQNGIVSISFLLDQALGTNENFHRKLFMVRYYDTFFEDPERVKSTLLAGLSEEKRNFVYNHEKYGWSTFGLLYQWIILLNNQEAIDQAKWLKSELGLTDDEIKKILGKNSYLGKFYTYFSGRLIKEFNCDASGCQLLFKQLTDGAILKVFGLKNLQELSKLVSPNGYSFESPEINVYYEKEFAGIEGRGSYPQTSPYSTRPNSLSAMQNNELYVNERKMSSPICIYYHSSQKFLSRLFEQKSKEKGFSNNIIEENDAGYILGADPVTDTFSASNEDGFLLELKYPYNPKLLVQHSLNHHHLLN